MTNQSDRKQLVKALAGYREEWQQIAQDESLLDVESLVGLILSDIADNLNLNPQERRAMLGGKLNRQVKKYIEQPIKVKLPS